MKTLCSITIFSVLLGSYFPSAAMADYKIDIGTLPQPQIFLEEKIYQNANEGTTSYELDCSTNDDPNNDTAYSIEYNFKGNKSDVTSVRFSGGENMEVHDYVGSEILIDDNTHNIIFRGIGSLNPRLTQLTLENGEVQKCLREAND